jgi:AraC-type DNA-binding domain-containing proteins
MKDFELFCDYCYRDSLIPIYLYEKHNLIAVYPKQNNITHPPHSYLTMLWQKDSPLNYIMTNFYSFFGCIQYQENPEIRLIIGPVSNVPYTHEVLRILYREYFIATNDRNEFEAFFQNISPMTLTAFLTKLLFINFSLNHTTLHLSDIMDMSQPQNSFEINNRHVENMYVSKESGSFNNSYEVEKKILSLIEKGNVEGLKNFTSNSMSIHEGIIASNAIRQVKNTTIVMITLSTRAAIRGGLPTEIAFQLSDLYIQKLEHLTTIEEIHRLSYEAIFDFTHRVSASQIPTTSDDAIQRAIQFVLKNTNVHLTVSDVANHLGFSRSYFTHRFKKELGFDLSAFIIRCKLEEAKYLLAYTDKSISDISNYLCFSSQSHFQTAFKKQYHITPLEYRKNTPT